MRIPSVNQLFSTRVASTVGTTGAQSFGAVLAAETQGAQETAQTAPADGEAAVQTAETTPSALAGLSAQDLAVLQRLQQAVLAQRAQPVVTAAAATPKLMRAPDADSAQAGTVIDYALQFVGTPYVWGGEDLEKGVDCSGFTQSVFGAFGIDLPRTANRQAQSQKGEEVGWNDLQPGDLVFFKTADYAPVTHVALYLGDSKIVHASSSRDEVLVTNLDTSYWRSHFVTARRFL